MTIFDVPNMDEATAWERVRATLERHPLLKRIYYDPALTDIIRQRQPNKNALLFWLVLPADDERSVRFWTSVTDDLTVLEPFGAIEKCRDKMRQKEREYLESWRTEVWIAAWLVQNGVRLTLEPAVGLKRPELVTETTPATWWEIKTPLDPKPVTDDAAVLADIQRRIHEIPEPFVLLVRSADLRLQAVPAAVRGIKAQVRAFAQSGAEPPTTIECDGLIVEITARTKNKLTGFLGGLIGSGYLFGNPYRKADKGAAADIKDSLKEFAGITVLDAQLSEKIIEKIDKAIEQLPDDEAGVVVIDRTLSEWVHNEDVLNACFGEDGMVVKDGKLVTFRENAFFRPGAGTRVSAVVSFSRHPMYWEHGYELEIYHNPCAKVSIPEEMFRFPGVKQVRRTAQPDGSFRLDTVEEPWPEGS
ncbi:MAG: hypothetical protein WAN59_03625 [Candidatus Baltobacteraceae bacterium]